MRLRVPRPTCRGRGREARTRGRRRAERSASGELGALAPQARENGGEAIDGAADQARYQENIPDPMPGCRERQHHQMEEPEAADDNGREKSRPKSSTGVSPKRGQKIFSAPLGSAQTEHGLGRAQNEKRGSGREKKNHAGVLG